jgi:protein-S-isoprenylcysteine O-methyltransferase Ste14
MGTELYAYAACIVVYRVVESLAMRRAGSYARRPRRDWTMALIVVPYYLVLVGPLLEHLAFEWRPGPVNVALGGLCFAAAAFFRAKAHLDLGRGFSMAIERTEGAGLVDTGLYRTVRHPLYLGNVFLFIACPLFLAARLSYIVAGLGLIGVLIRIRIEEAFLMSEFEDYEAYAERTWALVPGLY